MLQYRLPSLQILPKMSFFLPACVPPAIMLVQGTICAVTLYFSAPVTVKAMLGNAASHPVMAKSGIIYLQLISFFYPLCYTGGTFTGTYNGLGKMVLTLAGSTLQIALCVILTWFFFPHFGLAAPAIATGIGWLMANLFWLICLTRLRRQSLLQA